MIFIFRDRDRDQGAEAPLSTYRWRGQQQEAVALDPGARQRRGRMLQPSDHGKEIR